MTDSNNILKKNIGQRLLQLRKKLNLSQVELARQLNVSNGTVSGVENGNIFPSFNVIYHLVNQFNLNPFFLLNGQEPMFQKDKPTTPLPANLSCQQVRFIDNFIDDFNRSEMFRLSIMAYCKKFHLKYAKLMQKEKNMDHQQGENDNNGFSS